MFYSLTIEGQNTTVDVIYGRSTTTVDPTNNNLVCFLFKPTTTFDILDLMPTILQNSCFKFIKTLPLLQT